MMDDKVVKLTYKDLVDANVGGKSILNMPDVMLIGTGGSGLHEARTIFMDDKKDAFDYIVAYDPVIEGGLSIFMRTQFENGSVIIEQKNFSKIEGPGIMLWKRKHNMAKNRNRKYITKSFYKRYKLI